MYQRKNSIKYAFFCLLLASGCVSETAADKNDVQSAQTDASETSHVVDVGACSAASEGQACNDGDPCTTGEVCRVGVCDDGVERDCSVFDTQCGASQCDSTTGMCEASPVREGQDCNDASACTTNDTCQAGACVGQGMDCSEYDSECTQGVCHPATGACAALAVNEGSACEDGDLCTVGESCVRGQCGHTSPVDCSGVGDACNVASCDPLTGACETVPASDGDACEDGDLCTVAETCQAGACVGGAPKDCSWAAGDCAQAACDGSNGSCVVEPINEGGSCQDDNVCTTDGICSASVCSGTPVAPPHDECTAGERLSSGCTLCVSFVCFEDAYCCETEWDSLCVRQAEIGCGFSCP